MIPVLLCAAIAADSSQPQSLPVRPGWELVWGDAFEGSGVPDAARWDYEVGFVRNKELQFYTKARPENARRENGRLVLEARPEEWPNPGYKADATEAQWQANRKNATVTSASVISLGKQTWRYGRIEVSAKVPKGKGVWPAIWMLGENRSQIGWPRCGEIDIMEFVGHTPGKIFGTIHWAKAEGGHTSNGGNINLTNPWDGFHAYAIEWNEDRIDWFFDDTKYHSFDLSKADLPDGNAFRKPHYLLLNLAIGGSWGGPVDPGVLPAKFEVDYVAVYRRAGS